MQSIHKSLIFSWLCQGRWVAVPALAGISILMVVGSVVVAQPHEMQTLLVTPVTYEKVPMTATLVGSVLPARRSVVASPVDGVVRERLADEGDRVEAGAVLCRLRDVTRRLALTTAEERLKELQAVLEELRAGSRPEEIAKAKAVMEEARAVMDKWQKELTRIEALKAQNAASEKEYNDTVSDHAAARERFEQAKADYDLVVAGPRKEEIAQAEFAMMAQEADVKRLSDEVEKTIIRAPFTADIVRKHVEIGEWTNAGGPVMEVIELNPVRVRVDVPEASIRAVETGLKVSVSVDALDEIFRGTVTRVISQADVRARTFPVDIEIPNEGYRLKAGMFARARMPSGPTLESLVVPRDAVIQRQGSHLVVTVVPSPDGKGHMAMPTPVHLGADIGDRVAVVAANLAPGTMVAVKGHDRVYGPTPVLQQLAKGAETQPAEEDESPATRPASGTEESVRR